MKCEPNHKSTNLAAPYGHNLCGRNPGLEIKRKKCHQAAENTISWKRCFPWQRFILLNSLTKMFHSKTLLSINNNLSQSLFRFVSTNSTKTSFWALYLCAVLKITLSCYTDNWLVIYNATTRWCTLVITMEVCVICSEAWFQDIYLCLHSCGCFGHTVV